LRSAMELHDKHLLIRKTIENNKFVILLFHNWLQVILAAYMLFVSYLYSIDEMKNKKSDNSKKKNTTKRNKKTSVSRRRSDTGKDRTLKTRQQQVSKTKTKPSKSKQQQQELVIKRSSGRKEKFDTNRMAQTVGRSGVPFLMARDVAKTVSNKIKHEAQQQAKGRQSSNKSKPTQLKEKTVTASRIRNLVSNELRDRNRSDIAASYSGQTPENTLPEEDLKDKQPTIADTTAANRNRVLHDQSKRGGGIMTWPLRRI
jgi:transcriptional repressor NrdR